MNEERFSPWGEPEDDEQKQSSARNRFDSIMDFLRSSKEDEDDSEKGKRRKKAKSSRWRKFMRRMLSGESSEDDQDDGHERPKGALASLVGFELLESDPDKSEGLYKEAEQSNQENLTTNHTPKTATNETANNTLSRTEEHTTESAETHSALDVEHNEGSLDQQSDTESQEKAPQEVNRASIDVLPDYARQFIEPAQPSTDLPEVDQRGASASAASKTEQDTTKTAGNPTGLLLGLDYLNYRGRKKLEKQVEKQNEQLKKQEKSLKEQAESLQHTKEQQKPLESEPNKKEKAPVQEGGLLVIDHSDEQQQASNKETIQPIQKLERQPEPPKPKKQENPKEAPKIELAKSKEIEEDTAEVKQSKKLEQVRSKEDTSIEQEQRIQQQELLRIDKELLRQQSSFNERTHERRHEVRDEAKARQSQNITSVGEVLKANYSDRSAGVYPHPSHDKPIPSSSKPALDTAAPTYPHAKQDTLSPLAAIKSGFFTGLIVIAGYITIRLFT